MNSTEDEGHLGEEITRLETKLLESRMKLKALTVDSSSISSKQQAKDEGYSHYGHDAQTSAAHALLLLSDSALPLGSFAFSSGLESYLAHHPSRPAPSILPFLALSLRSVASTVLPYLLAAHKDPAALVSLDDTLDACTLCHVARRASIAQGSALLTLWERAFRATVEPKAPAALALAEYARKLKSESNLEVPNGHFVPIWAVVTAAMGISVRDSAYAFLLNHAKAVLSAAVRASMVGPYQAQTVLAGYWLRQVIPRFLDENWEVPVEDAGQGVPMMDLWIGRHEMLYSRIFNS